MTRIVFLQTNPVFYDSFEYVRIVEKVQEKGVTEAVKASHQPVHTLYLLIAGVVGEVTGIPGEVVLAILSLIAGLMTVVIWSETAKELGGSRWSGFVLAFLPGLMVFTTNIMYEAFLLMWQVLMLWAIGRYFRLRQFKWLWLSGIFAGLGHLVSVGNLFFWLPLIIYWVIKRQLSWLDVLRWSTGMVSVVGIVDLMVLGSLGMIWEKYLSYSTSFVSFEGGLWLWGFRIGRNVLLASWNLLGPLGIICVVWGWWKDRREKEQWMWWVMLGATFVSVQYWHVWYWGRVGASLLLVASFWIGKLWMKSKWRWLMLAALVTQGMWIGGRQWNKSYIQALKEKVSGSVGGERYVTSDSVRMAYEQSQIDPLLIVREPESDLVELKILTEQGTLLIDEAALTYPYWQPDGWSYQILSKRNGTMLIKKWVEAHCELKSVYRENSKPPLTIYELRNCEE